MTDQPNLTARVTRRFDAPPERVFSAWIDPEMLGRWMFGRALRDEEIVRLSVDARVGGAFSFVVRRQGQEIDHLSEYLQIKPPRRLAFTWSIRRSDSSNVLVEIAPQDAGCQLTLTHELHPDWADYVERTVAGWTKMLGAPAVALS